MGSRKLQRGMALKDVLAFAFILFVFYVLFGGLFEPHRIRENARRASCQMNLKQLGLAFIQYTQDNDGEFPQGRAVGGAGWAGQVYPYVKSTGIYVCPDDRGDGPHISYTENLHLVHQKMTTLTHPALTVQLYEDSTPDCDPSTPDCDPSTPETVSAVGLSAPQDSQRHDSTTFMLNFLAVDGHVKYLKPGLVSNGLNAVPPKQAADRGYVMTFAIR